MKKISILSLLMVMLGLAFTSCKEDTEPRLQVPTEFVLNVPEFAHQLYYVEEGGSINFACSQANYGLGTTPVYQLEISKTETFEESVKVDYTTQIAAMTIPAEPFAKAVCALYAWEDPEEVTAVPLYVRCISAIPNGAEEYTIASNVVKLDSVLVYFAVELPDAIYLIGAPQGWNISDDSMPLMETEIGSRIYKGTYNIPENQFQFRFYDELGDWNFFSIGAQDEDNAVDITLTDGEYAGGCFYDPATEKAGKGAWNVANWAGGDVEMTVNLNNNTVVFKAL